MPRAVMTWLEDDVLCWAALTEDGENSIGRGQGCTVKLDGAKHPTVSREHASVAINGSRFVLRHRSARNRTRVNDVVVDGANPIGLKDGDRVELGGVHLVFHDLASGDRTSGWICSTCRHENPSTNAECWFDGTSRAYADSMISVWHPVICRALVEREGGRNTHDLYVGQMLAILSNGTCTLKEGEPSPEGAILGIEGRRTDSVLHVFDSGEQVTLNDGPAADGQALRTGDQLGAGGAHLFVVVR